jgi:hypothetical protein
MSKTLLEELNIKDVNYNITNYDIIDYEPPNESGLSNSNVIIPSYYNLDKNPQKIFDIDYYDIIKDDIKNLRVLNKYQLHYIKQLSHKDKNELFDIFNLCIASINELL